MRAACLAMRAFLILTLVGSILALDVSRTRAAPPQQGQTTHVVRRGETLGWIAAHYGTTVSAIARVNNIRNRNLIYGGQRLVIPTHSAPPPVPPPVPSRRTGGSNPGSCTHRVVRGDTLSRIAARYGTTVGQLMSLNGLRSSRILVGQALRVCGSSPKSVSATVKSVPAAVRQPGKDTYRVRAGDTLSRIAMRYHTTVRAIMIANGLRNAHHIYVGQALVIPH